MKQLKKIINVFYVTYTYFLKTNRRNIGRTHNDGRHGVTGMPINRVTQLVECSKYVSIMQRLGDITAYSGMASWRDITQFFISDTAVKLWST